MKERGGIGKREEERSSESKAKIKQQRRFQISTYLEATIIAFYSWQ